MFFFVKVVDVDVVVVMVVYIDVFCFSGWIELVRKFVIMCVDIIVYLRDVLFFEGVIILDCMEMGVIVKEYRIEEVVV